MKTIILLTISNVFMTFAWYGQWNHLVAFGFIVGAVFFMFYEW